MFQPKTITELSEEDLSLLEKQNVAQVRIPSGFSDLDEQFGGLPANELIVLAARPGMGKTTFLMQMALNVSKRQPVLYVSVYEQPYPLAKRFHSCMSGIELIRLSSEPLSREELIAMKFVSQDLSSRKLFIVDQYEGSQQDFIESCRQSIRQQGIKLLIIEDLYKVSKGKDEEVAMFKAMLQLARSENVCIIVSTSLTRFMEFCGSNQRPTLSNCEEEYIVNLADKLIFLFRPRYYGLLSDPEHKDTTGVMEVIVAKNNHGPTGKFCLRHDKSFTCLYYHKPNPPDKPSTNCYKGGDFDPPF